MSVFERPIFFNSFAFNLRPSKDLDLLTPPFKPPSLPLYDFDDQQTLDRNIGQYCGYGFDF